MKHIPQLDGIRGIAILLVMTTHFVGFEPWTVIDRLFVKASDTGWLGVDLFFVLSGFLITGILLDTKNRPNYFSEFLKRRALRIFPLYIAFVCGLWVVASVTTWPDSQLWLESQGWYWLYGVNYLLATEGTWAAGPLRSGHLWSLAVEEQFYLLWPLVVWWCSRRQLLVACTAIIAGALALRIGMLQAGVNELAIFVSTPTRIDTLAAGAIGAILVREASQEALKRVDLAIIPCSLVMLSCLAMARGKQYGWIMQSIGYTSIALTFGIAIMASSQSATIRPWLSGKVLTFFGRYSYALYMLHGLAFAIVAQLLPPIKAAPGVTVAHLIAGRAVLAGALSIAFALVSWHLLEKWFLRLKDRGAPRSDEQTFEEPQPAEPLR